MWEKFRLLVFNSKITSISFFFLLLLTGMGTASIVNWISVTPVFAKSFYLGFFIAGTMIILGVIIFQPFFAFRFKYRFLDEYDEIIASLIHRFKKKSESRLINTDGVIGIRLFRVEKHTLPDDSLYVFNIVFDLVSKYSSVDKLKPKEIKVPILLDKWIQENIIDNIEKTNVQYDINTLNNMNMDKYTTQMLLYYFVEYFREENEGKSERWLKKILKKPLGSGKSKLIRQSFSNQFTILQFFLIFHLLKFMLIT
ncbi:hypothetical protein [Planococcus sp. SSTMD024]|uniref:hypothetical protein n=1 Tax=Planococcus sp. SSTMD024 TaxID=3242163 RepID=UPI00351EA1C7